MNVSGSCFKRTGGAADADSSQERSSHRNIPSGDLQSLLGPSDILVSGSSIYV